MRISDWSSDVCSSDLRLHLSGADLRPGDRRHLVWGTARLDPGRGRCARASRDRAGATRRPSGDRRGTRPQVIRLTRDIQGQSNMPLGMPTFFSLVVWLGRAHVWTSVTYAHTVCRLLV